MSSPHRLSTSSLSSSSSSSSTPVSPLFPTVGSSSALILVHDDEPLDNYNYTFNSTDEDDEFGSDLPLEARIAAATPLSPSFVFIYLLAPFLKLGAMLLPSTTLPPPYGFLLLGISAALSMFSRQIWYMLARYMRKIDLEDVVLDACARGRNKERLRASLRTVIRASTGIIRVALASLYMRESILGIHTLIPESSFLYHQTALTTVVSLSLIPISFGPTYASKRVKYATLLSVSAYIAWFGLVSSAYSHGGFQARTTWSNVGSLWHAMPAFVFATSSTLPLYASLKAESQTTTTAKPSRFQSFRLLSVISIVVALFLTVPLVIYTVIPVTPKPVVDNWDFPVSFDSEFAIVSLQAATLLLGIPFVLCTTPALPVPERIRHSTRFPISRTVVLFLVCALSLLPDSLAHAMNDLLLVLSLGATYFLPAILHVFVHFFRRPLAIVVSHSPGNSRSHSSSPRADDLLLRKERALQLQQWRKRLLWDLGVWSLLTACVLGLVWGVGSLAGKW